MQNVSEQIAQLNVVIAELNLVAAKLATNTPPANIGSLLDQAKLDLAEVTRSIIGQNPMTGSTN